MAEGESPEMSSERGGSATTAIGVETAPHPPLHQTDLRNVVEVSPRVPAIQPLTHIRVGFTLSIIFSSILAVYLIAAAISVWMSERQTFSRLDVLSSVVLQGDAAVITNQNGTITNKFQRQEIEAFTKGLSDTYREARAATIDFHKTIVINVLLPILTALLGYLFGNRERANVDDERESS